MMGNITTPCHDLPPILTYGYEGRAYLQERVLDGYMCPAERCLNGWDADGVADPYNKGAAA